MKRLYKTFFELPIIIRWLLFISMVSILVWAIAMVSIKRPINKVQQAHNQVFSDSLQFQKIQNEKDSINTAFTHNVDSAKARTLSKYGITIEK